MKRGLTRKADRGTGQRDARELQRIDRLQVVEPGARRGGRLLAQRPILLGLRADEIPVQALEIALDGFLAHDAFDQIDGRRVTAGRGARTVRSEKPLELHEAIVQHRR